MPITEVSKIWMNGELVDWADARVHVLTHALHYGSGVFEGIRAYDTKKGTHVYRLTDHIERLMRSAKIYMMDVPFSTGGTGAGDQGSHPGEFPEELLHTPVDLSWLRRDGALSPAGAGGCLHRRLALGHISRRRGDRAWHSRQDLLFPALRAKQHATGSQGDGQYINSSLAKVERRLRAVTRSYSARRSGQPSEGSGGEPLRGQEWCCGDADNLLRCAGGNNRGYGLYHLPG